VRGSKCVPAQIFQSFLVRSVLPTLFEKYCSVIDMHVHSLMNRLLCSGTYVRKTKVSVDDVHLYGRPVFRTLTLCESLAYRRTHGFLPMKTMYRIYHRLSYKSLYISSAGHKPANRNSDDAVQLTDGHFCSLMCCAVGKFYCRCLDPRECTDSVALFVTPFSKVFWQPAFRNKTTNVTSDRFLNFCIDTGENECIAPDRILRKCFTHKRNYTIILPPKVLRYIYPYL